MADESTYKEYLQIAESNPDWRILSNGAIHNGRHIVANPPGGPDTAITQSNAVALATQRWDELRERWVQAGDLKADSITGGKLKAWEAMSSHILELAITKNDRTAVEAARLWSQNAGYTADKDASSQPAVRLELSAGALDAIMDRLERRAGYLASDNNDLSEYTEPELSQADE